MTTHTEYNERTPATEVAKAFSDEIKDKHCKHGIPQAALLFPEACSTLFFNPKFLQSL